MISTTTKILFLLGGILLGLAILAIASHYLDNKEERDYKSWGGRDDIEER